LAKWAGMLSTDGRFVHWAVEADRELWDECFRVTEPIGAYGEVAAEFIRRKCGIHSRRELDHNKQAGLIFREEIMKPYHQWKEQQK
jgi:hypothetical protein